jgi:hypothetical protein
MKFKEYYEYIITPADRIDVAFINKILPSNAFIHKGRCGIGGTTLFLKSKMHTITTVPNNQIIHDKKNDPFLKGYEIFAVEGKVTPLMIREYLVNTLNTPGAYIRIMSTPDSFYKIIEAAKDIAGFNLFQDCFLLLDECHTFVTEAFRKAILTPFKWFWEFENKSVISATPYYFTDKRFEAFEHHQVKFTEPYLGEVNVVKAISVPACLNHAITKGEYPGNVHIFYNSVTESVKAIKRAGLTDGNMFFADRSENQEKLEGIEAFYQDEPRTPVYKKFNFYTCKYNEGWDLYDDNATIILVTDINATHTRVRISNKGIQAIGRSRNKPHKIYHITNQRNTNKVKTQEQINTDYNVNADNLIRVYNYMIDNKIEPMPGVEEMITKFADINTDKTATHNDYKFDQMVNDTLTNEEYADMQIIGEQWEKGLYRANHLKHEERLPKDTTIERRKSKADKLKTILDDIERLELDKAQYAFNQADNELADIKLNHPLAYQAYYELGKELITKLNYKEAAIKVALIEHSNITAKQKLFKLLDMNFDVNGSYLKSEVKHTLQRLYNTVELKDKQGNIKLATAEQLGEAGRFEIEESKIKVGNDWKPSFRILRKQFGLKLAA